MNLRFALFCAAAATSLYGCGQGAHGTTVARVGDETISEAELQRALSESGATDAEAALSRRGQAVDALIDARLLSRAALNDELDRKPEVRLAIEDARRKVLGEAYMARRYKDLAPPSETEINDYYLEHPALFAGRRIYRMQEIDMFLPASRLAEVESHIKQSRSLDDFSAWLGGQGIETRIRQTVSPAERVAPAFLAELATLQDGQVIVQVTGRNRIRVVQLLSSEAQPLSLDQARGAISRVLAARAREARLASELRALRRDETIEYVQGFSPIASSPAAPGAR